MQLDESIRGDKYDERADVSSFGIIMWQVVTRKEPYAGRNFMGVSLDVLEGKRPPQVPNDCPSEIEKLMKKCWQAQDAHAAQDGGRVGPSIDCQRQRRQRRRSANTLRARQQKHL